MKPLLILTLLTARFTRSVSRAARSMRCPRIWNCSLILESAPTSLPDNQRIAFMDKSFGDAFVIDLKTRIIRCLTCNVPGAVFLRVMHFSNGDYLLIGPQSSPTSIPAAPRTMSSGISAKSPVPNRFGWATR